MGPGPAAGQRAELEGMSHVTLVESAFRLEWMVDPWEDVAAAGRWLLDLARTFKPDLVHVNGFAHASLSWRVPVVVVAHSCVLSWWRAVKNEAAPATWLRYRREVARGLRAADIVVAPSHSMARALCVEYQFDGAVTVIYNGKRGRCLQNIVPKEQMILSVGRLWDEAKNVLMLAEIAGEIPWPVMLAGEAVSPSGTTPELPHVTLTGHLPAHELWELYDRAMIYAAPARYEPFGLSVLEAALSGCALVLGDIPTFREIWGEAALYVSPDDPQMMSAAITRLVFSPAEIQRRGATARSRALLYSSSRMCGAYEQVYASLVGQRQSPVKLLPHA
jgi:glycosyltransferase involved in cell wall biosynthesis